MDKEQKIYEIGYLLTPLVPEEKIDEEVAQLRGEIEKNHGLILTEGRPKSQRLAYPIKALNSPTKGFGTAYFGWIKFLVDAEALLKIKDGVDKNQNLLRFLLIHHKAKEVAAKKPAKKRARTRIIKSAEPKVETEIKVEEIDKKLEELIGN